MLSQQGMEGLYTEKEGKWHLTGIKGMKTQADIDAVKATLDKERKNLAVSGRRKRKNGLDLGMMLTLLKILKTT